MRIMITTLKASREGITTIVSQTAKGQPLNFWALHTPPKTNMEPEKKSLEKEAPLGNHHFQVPC